MRQSLSLLLFLVFVLVACVPANLPPDGDTIPWAKAVELLHNGQVTMVAQLHSGEVRLTLINGAEISTTSPYLDAIFDEVQSCGDPCADTVLAME